MRCVYDLAKTPLQRLLFSGVLPTRKQQELTRVAQSLDPIRLFQQVEHLHQAVFRWTGVVLLLLQAYHLHLFVSFLWDVVQQETFLSRGAFPIR